MTLEIRSVSGVAARELTGLDIDIPVVSRIGMDGDEIIGAGGLAFGGGRTWLWFFAAEGARGVIRRTLAECETMKRRAVQLGSSEIYTPRDANYPTSERLLKLAGFEKTDEFLDDREVWIWRAPMTSKGDR